MIIDLILDRKSGVKYSANEFYLALMSYRDVWSVITAPITRAMDEGIETDVQRELCNYVKEQQWPESICNYIKSVKWVEDDPEGGMMIDVTYDAERQDGTIYEEHFVTYQQRPDIYKMNPSDKDSVEKECMRPLNEAVSIALRMGWKLWHKLTLHVPEIGYRCTIEPRSKEHALDLQDRLEAARVRGEAMHAVTEVMATETVLA